MKRFSQTIAFALICFTSALFSLESSDRIVIDAIVTHFTDSWNKYEGKGTADYYAEDADFINIFGVVFSGQEEIERRHLLIHETFMKGTLFEVIECKLREIQEGLVTAQVYWNVSGIQKPCAQKTGIQKTSMQNSGNEEKGSMKGIFTHTFVKNKGKWEIVATQNTLISN